MKPKTIELQVKLITRGVNLICSVICLSFLLDWGLLSYLAEYKSVIMGVILILISYGGFLESYIKRKKVTRYISFAIFILGLSWFFPIHSIFKLTAITSVVLLSVYLVFLYTPQQGAQPDAGTGRKLTP